MFVLQLQSFGLKHVVLGALVHRHWFCGALCTLSVTCASLIVTAFVYRVLCSAREALAQYQCTPLPVLSHSGQNKYIAEALLSF